MITECAEPSKTVFVEIEIVLVSVMVPSQAKVTFPPPLTAANRLAWSQFVTVPEPSIFGTRSASASEKTTTRKSCLTPATRGAGGQSKKFSRGGKLDLPKVSFTAHRPLTDVFLCETATIRLPKS